MFHVNPETGDAGPCKATKGKCPFGGIEVHFTSVEAARAHYEKIQESKPTITGTSTGEPTVYEFREANLELAKKSIEAANRRLEKAGVEERFTYELEEYMKVSSDRDGFIQTAEPYIRMTVNTPSVKFEGYQFLAAVEKADAGFVVKTATGVNLHGYSPDDMRCDACGKAMGRQKTYLVQDANSKLLQVGSSCVKNYFGVEPQGLWALTYDPLQRATNNERWHNPGGDYRGAAVPTSDLLAYALAVSNGGENFVSRSAAENYGGLSTADQVKSALFGRDLSWQQEMQREAQRYIANGEAQKLLEKLKATDPSTGFGRNLSVVANGEWTRYNHINILVGGLSQMAAEKRNAAKAAHEAKWGTPKRGFVGQVGDKWRDRTFKVYSATHREKDDPYSYRGGEITTTKVVMRDEDNHEIIWWASKKIDVDEGDELTISSGTVKKHDTYRGVDQTTITKVRMKDIKRQEGEAEEE